ncbi:hypothetical protein DY023_03350 [Microbacterium bovistercoris]|uniref:Uncharacterized protein n=1 Tax=Microbacterium bovistercoris TaxID=2293570 RepID=A0A371NX04_9MICO|nr:hypothetical protein [Microbacterium bovistercoris]REJ07680.1 hypothetical protein DY023_03350 [Microbacterium bovistercoris]
MLKLLMLVLAGFLVWAIFMGFEEFENLFAVIVLCVFLIPCVIACVWMALFMFTVPMAARLRVSTLFRRVRPGAGVRDAPNETAVLPEGALISGTDGQGLLLQRTVAYLVLGLPAAVFLGYCLVAYLNELQQLLFGPPSVRYWDWRAPSNFTLLGEEIFTDDNLGALILVPAISAVFLFAGTALAALALPVLTRRGADAIDLAVTDTGVIVRGGLSIGWDEITEIMVVRDTRAGAVVGQRQERFAGQPRAVINLTFFPHHSRTRIVFIPRDFPALLARAGRRGSRGLHADRALDYGYALADLWVHEPDEVDAVCTGFERIARRTHITLTRHERGTGMDDLLASSPGWLGGMFTRN